MKFQIHRVLRVIAVVAVAALTPMYALAQGSTGSISGMVTNAADSKPLETVNVRLLTTTGTDIEFRIVGPDGRYSFEGVPAGTYKLEFRLISYTTVQETVTVTAGEATTVNAALEQEVYMTIDVLKITESKLDELKKEQSGSVRTVDTAAQSKIRAINNTDEAIATQAGVTQLGNDFFVRGGRSSEVKTVIDGMPVSDAFAGSTGGGTLDVSISSQEGLTFLTGGFDAEYGNAQSGIIEIATKEGGDQYEGQVKFLTDDFGAPDKTYFNYDNVAFGFGGPVPFLGDSFRFYFSGEGVFQDTYLKTLEQRAARRLTFNGTELASLRDRQENALSGQAKVTYRFPDGSKKLSAEYLFSRTEDDWYHHAFSRIGYWSEANQQWWFEPLDSTYTYYNGPEHNSERETKNDQYKMVYTHPLTSDSFIKARLALFRNRYKESVADKPPERYVSFTGDDTERDPQNLFFAVRGDYPIWEERESDRWTFRADYQNRIGSPGDAQSSSHQLRTGITADFHHLRKDRRTFPDEEDPFGNFPNIYDQKAVGGVFYIQDKLRYKKSMVMNAGLRFDFFDPGEEAIRVSNQRVLSLEQPTEGTSFFERWKAQISPRLGMSYPISDRDVLHFHYGRFFQLPALELLYDFSGSPGVGNQTVGNAFLEPETTISYEFGVRRQLSESVYIDATVFFKDIFGLVGTQPLEAENETEQNQFANNTYFNQDYGSVRGFEVALDKKFSSYWQGGVAYTLSRATGSSSDINQGATVAGEGQDRPPIREVPLDWDRTHVFNAYLYFSDPGVWGLNFDLAIGTGAPETPVRLGQRTIEAEDINTIRLPSTMTLNIRANKQYSLYGQEFRLFLEGRNVLDRQNVNTVQPNINPLPDQEYYQEYFTEFGELGGAYNLADTIGAAEDILIPLNDPRVYGESRVFRFGIQFEF